MFSGIIEEVGVVREVRIDKLVMQANRVLDGTKPGDSIAVNGTCLTVVKTDTDSFVVDIMPETIKRTNLNRLRYGDAVNLERALILGNRIGGHLVQGHIDGVGRIKSMIPEGEAILMTLILPDALVKYSIDKGFIAIDGVSLTVFNRRGNMVTVSLVGYTLNHTNLSGKRPSDEVNLEMDLIGKFVENFMSKV